jgi:hypothetical protein
LQQFYRASAAPEASIAARVIVTVRDRLVGGMFRLRRPPGWR